MRKKVLEAVCWKWGFFGFSVVWGMGHWRWVGQDTGYGFTKQCQHPVFLLCLRRHTSLKGNELKENLHSRLYVNITQTTRLTLYSAYNETLEKRGPHLRCCRQRTRERRSNTQALISTEKRLILGTAEEAGSEVDPLQTTEGWRANSRRKQTCSAMPSSR